MAGRGDNASLRAALAALAAIAALLGFVLWQSLATTFKAATDEASAESCRAATLQLARWIDARSPVASGGLAGALSSSGVDVAAALYGADGERTEVAAARGLETIAASLPNRAPVVGDDGGPAPVAARPSSTPSAFAIRLGDARTLVVASPGTRVASLGWTVAAYQALTLVVVLAAIGFGIRRLGLRRQTRLEARPGPTAASTPGAQSEADFVVETFQSVIGELQVKGRRLELESLRERERAERSERFSGGVIAQMPTGLVVVDPSGRVTAANASARELFADLPRGRTDAVDVRHAFRGASDLVGMIEACLHEGAAFSRREIEMRGEHAGARPRCLGVSVSPLGPESEPEAALCLMTDLTEVVELRDRVRLQETMASLGEMAAGLAHEMKNSLATIQGYAQLIADISPETAEEPTDAIVDEVASLARMVTDFLNFARPQEVVRAPVAIAPLVEHVAERLEPSIAAASVELEVRIAPDAVTATVLGDETLLGRAISNVILNAVEALDLVAPPRRCRVDVVRAGDHVLVDVSDNATGIAPEDVSRVFIPFFTTRSRGHGIGLALTQKIVLAHGGLLTVDSTHGEGTVFHFQLPAGR